MCDAAVKSHDAVLVYVCFCVCECCRELDKEREDENVTQQESAVNPVNMSARLYVSAVGRLWQKCVP